MFGLFLDTVETAIEYRTTGESGNVRTRYRAVKFRAGAVYPLDEATFDRMVGLGLVESHPGPATAEAEQL